MSFLAYNQTYIFFTLLFVLFSYYYLYLLFLSKPYHLTILSLARSSKFNKQIFIHHFSLSLINNQPLTLFNVLLLCHNWLHYFPVDCVCSILIFLLSSINVLLVISSCYCYWLCVLIMNMHIRGFDSDQNSSSLFYMFSLGHCIVFLFMLKLSQKYCLWEIN